LFKTNDINTVSFCQLQFGCQLPSVVFERRIETLMCKFKLSYYERHLVLM